MPKISPAPVIPVSRIAQLVKGTVSGNSDTLLRSLSSLDAATSDSLVFCADFSGRRLVRAIEDTAAGAVLVADTATEHLKDSPKTVIFVKDPMLSFIEIVPLFHQQDSNPLGVHETAVVHASAILGKNISIGPFSVIGEGCAVEDDVVIGSHVALYPRARVGARTTIHAHVVIREDSQIAADCTIHSGTVIGSDGFGYHFVPGRGLILVPQVGNVAISSHVEVGANSCIDRGTLGSTIVGAGVKIDNLVQVGHNCVIGESSVLCGQVGLAGTTTLGAGVTLGGQVGVSGHLKIASGSRVAGASAVLTDLPEKGDYAGIPAIPVKQWRKQLISLARLIRPRSSKDQAR
jgi:UDP-3-O-[3-hydroxymyristoyl] glucosamine N-acyltransferase